MKFETKAIRIQSPRSDEKEHSTSIYATSSFVFDNAEDMRSRFAGESEGNIYSRFTNPTVAELEQKIAALEGGESGLATASGMSAIFTCFASFLSSGDHILMSRAVFGSTFKMTENFLHKWNISYDYADPSDTGSWGDLITTQTKIIYLETPSNPGLEILDLKKIVEIGKSVGALVVVDNCFATPYLQRPLEFGVDIVIHSATKFIDGQGRVLGGLIVSSAELREKMFGFLRNAGPSLSPFNAWVLTKSLETLAVRMDRHCQNALELAIRLEEHSSVSWVKYPFLPSHPQNMLAKKQMDQGGGIVSFELNGGLETGKKLLDNIQMISLSANLGDTRSIITHPAATTHAKLSPEQRAEVGITDGMIRISVGLEHIEDIYSDIDRAISMISI